jgi:2,4-dienoyl-CoA reductase-like NADH-dependent reductase (Old Yellow Enzyme family)
MSQYYREFDRGGFGVVITEGTYTDTTRSGHRRPHRGLAADR